MTQQFTYQPGVCNIDNTGAQARKKLAYIGLVLGMIVLGLLYYFHIHLIYRVIVGAGTGSTTALNLFQARDHFCVTNASLRTFETSLHRTKITNDLYKDADRKKMRSMIGKSLIYAVIGGCLGLLPL